MYALQAWRSDPPGSPDPSWLGPFPPGAADGEGNLPSLLLSALLAPLPGPLAPSLHPPTYSEAQMLVFLENLPDSPLPKT